MNIQDLKSNTTWQEASNTINNNNNKISLAIATLENAKLKNKGYFITVEKLNEAIPNPTIGSKAYVGTSEPYAIYIVENGAWVDSGYTGGDEIVAKITTDRIEDGAVTSEKIATSAFDSTLSVSGKIAPADVVGTKLNELKQELNSVGSNVVDASTSTDLDISDENGNVIMRLKDGHFQVKNFSSVDALESIQAILSNTGFNNVPEFDEETNYSVGDIVRYGKYVYVFTSAHTAGKWNSAEAERTVLISESQVEVMDNTNAADLDISDGNGNVIMRLKDGHIKTKFFDSSKITTGGGGGGGDGVGYPDLSTKTWCSLGTSITWYNNNQGGKFEKGYQGWLMEKLAVGTLVNKGINGGTLLQLAGQLGNIVSADIYTIEHGVNDWGRKSVVGTIDDYINNTGASTFYGAYRIIIDAIYAKNSKAVIVLCTPRKSRGFSGYLPSSCNGELNGIKLKDYADAVMEVARYEGLPVCDWFNRCGVNDHNLTIYSIDDALHPNDLGYKQMAQILIEQFNNIY